MQTLVNFAPLADIYDYFLIDLWGTIHDGKRLYPGVKDRLRHLKNLQKKIVLISNTPRPSSAIQPLLTSLGIPPHEYDHLITSGDTFLEEVGKNPELQKPFYFMGSDLHDSLLARLHAPTSDLATAHYILCSAVPPNYESILKKARSHNKLLICINPDLTVIDDGQSLACPGSIAQDYANQGGQVLYYGKPHPEIYNYALQRMGNPPKAKVLIIGDGLYTDILGANQYGIDSLLVNTGVHRMTEISNPQHAIEKLSRDLGMEPTYFLETLGEKYTPL